MIARRDVHVFISDNDDDGDGDDNGDDDDDALSFGVDEQIVSKRN